MSDISLRAMFEGYTTTESKGTISKSDLDALIDAMYDHVQPLPEYIDIFISLERARQILHWQHLAQLYRAYPVPPRQIRKCHMRKLQSRWKQGRERIHRIEQRERVQEEAQIIKQMREEQEV